jgi:hypothetical protein
MKNLENNSHRSVENFPIEIFSENFEIEMDGEIQVILKNIYEIISLSNKENPESG